MDYVSNMSLANFIGCLFSKDAKPTPFEETYSFLYNQEELDEIEQAKQEAERQRQLEIQRAWYKSFAESFNAKFENDSGENEDN